MYHPSYEGAYSEKKMPIPELPNSVKRNMHILFMGSVRPYKNIELILEAAKKLQGKILLKRIIWQKRENVCNYYHLNINQTEKKLCMMHKIKTAN